MVFAYQTGLTTLAGYFYRHLHSLATLYLPLITETISTRKMVNLLFIRILLLRLRFQMDAHSPYPLRCNIRIRRCILQSCQLRLPILLDSRSISTINESIVYCCQMGFLSFFWRLSIIQPYLDFLLEFVTTIAVEPVQASVGCCQFYRLTLFHAS